MRVFMYVCMREKDKMQEAERETKKRRRKRKENEKMMKETNIPKVFDHLAAVVLLCVLFRLRVHACIRV